MKRYRLAADTAKPGLATRKRVCTRFGLLLAAVAFILGNFGSPTSAQAGSRRAWLAVSPSSPGYEMLFSRPSTWREVAKFTDTFSISANEVDSLAPRALRDRASMIHRLGMKLDIGMSGLPVDKRVCGDGLEGMVWPGEPAGVARRLKQAGVHVDSFSFDLPLTNGHFSRAANACHFTISEVAARLSVTMRVLQSFYPGVKFVDVEVPTGMPAREWANSLRAWLQDINTDGERFSGFLLDIWWEFDWRQTAAVSATVLHDHDVRVGTFIDADRGTASNATEFEQVAKRNACMVRSLHLGMDYFVIANWMIPGVPILPETGSASLLSLVPWEVAAGACPGGSRDEGQTMR